MKFGIFSGEEHKITQSCLMELLIIYMTSLVNMAFVNVISTLSLLSCIKYLVPKWNNCVWNFFPKQARHAEKKLPYLKRCSSKQIVRLTFLIYMLCKASGEIQIIYCHKLSNHKGKCFLEKKYQKNLNQHISNFLYFECFYSSFTCF